MPEKERAWKSWILVKVAPSTGYSPTNLSLKNAMAWIGANQETETIFKARGIRFLDQFCMMSDQELFVAKLTPPQAEQLKQMSRDISKEKIRMTTPQTAHSFNNLSIYNQKITQQPKPCGVNTSGRHNPSPGAEGNVVRNVKGGIKTPNRAWYSQHSKKLRNHHGQWSTRQSCESVWQTPCGYVEYVPWYTENSARHFTPHGNHFTTVRNSTV